MNFSLGLYASCLMNIEVKFPIRVAPFSAFCRIFDYLEQYEDHKPTQYRKLEADTQQSESDAPDMLMGDWQTWK